MLLHRGHVITSENILSVEAIALGLAVLAVLMAIIAFVRLWFTGDQGWWKASLAFIFGILCLLPLGYLGYLNDKQPASTDISTDITNQPPLVN